MIETQNFFKTNMDTILEASVEVKEKFKNFKGAALVKLSHDTVDAISKKIDVKSKIQCGNQDCSYCCHSEIFISPVEAEYIRSKGGYTIDKALQQKQRTTDYKKLPFMDKACIMLKNGKCQVYDNRPVLCRNHNAVLGTDVLDCLKQNSLPGGFATTEIRAPILEAIGFHLIEKSLNNEFKNIAEYDW